MSNPIIWVDTDLIEEPLHLLRPGLTETQGYKDLLESMREDGFWAHRPLDCSEEKTPAGNLAYIMNDGMQRITAARTLGIRKVPVVLCTKQLSESERLERSIAANATTVPTRPVDYGKGLAKLVEIHETKGITVVDLAKRVRKNAAWVASMLRLGKLKGPGAELVNAGSISIANGLALVELQKAGIEPDQEFIEKAKHEKAEAFAEEVAAKIEEARGTRKRREPAAKTRKAADIKARLELALKDPTASPGFVAGLRYALRQDPVSAEAEGLPAPVTVVHSTDDATVAANLASKVELALTDDATVAEESEMLEVLHWALGSGAEEGEILPYLSERTIELLNGCEKRVQDAIKAIGVPTLTAKLKTNSVGRWFKGERRASYPARRQIFELLKDPIYSKQLGQEK